MTNSEVTAAADTVDRAPRVVVVVLGDSVATAYGMGPQDRGPDYTPPSARGGQIGRLGTVASAADPVALRRPGRVGRGRRTAPVGGGDRARRFGEPSGAARLAADAAGAAYPVGASGPKGHRSRFQALRRPLWMAALAGLRRPRLARVLGTRPIAAPAEFEAQLGLAMARLRSADVRVVLLMPTHAS